MTQYDAVIVGAGIIGLATAYHIKQQNPQEKILLIDKMGAAGQGNTARSAGMFRNFFYSPTNLELVRTSTGFYEGIPNLKIKWIRYLWLFHEEGYKKVEPVLREMEQRGLGFKLFDDHDLRKMLKINTKVTGDEEARMMGLADVSKAIFVMKAGSIDVDYLVGFYESRFKEQGGEIRYKTKAERIIVEPVERLGMPGEPYLWQKAKATGVKTDNGSIKAKKTIIAAGAWSPSILDEVGIETHIKPIKRQIFIVKADTPKLKELLHVKGLNQEGCMPFTILPNGVYFKAVPGEETFWLSYGDEFPRAFKLEDDPRAEEYFYRYGINFVVPKYYPQFKEAKLSSSFAGLYAKNTLDGQPVIFEENGIIVVGGTSGSGIMKADAVGRIAAALYAGEEYATLFGGEKFKASNLGLEERKVEPEKLII